MSVVVVVGSATSSALSATVGKQFGRNDGLPDIDELQEDEELCPTLGATLLRRGASK